LLYGGDQQAATTQWLAARGLTIDGVKAGRNVYR